MDQNVTKPKETSELCEDTSSTASQDSMLRI